MQQQERSRSRQVVGRFGWLVVGLVVGLRYLYSRTLVLGVSARKKLTNVMSTGQKKIFFKLICDC